MALKNKIKEARPWGNFIKFTSDESSTVKLISINAHSALSLQSHQSRDEFWRIISGEGLITIGDKKTSAQAGNEFFVPRQTKHRIQTDDSPLVFLEIATGKFDENDITRFEDIYGRATL